MNCFYHPDIPAVAECSNCGKGLCKKCIIMQQPILCDSCTSKLQLKAKYTEQNEEKKRRTSLLISLFIFIIVFVCCFFNKEALDISPNIIAFIGANFIVSFLFAGIPYGWYALSQIFSNRSNDGIIWIMSSDLIVANGIMKFILKTIFSFLIGWFLLLKEIFHFIKTKTL